MASFDSARQSGHMTLRCGFADTVVASVSHNDVVVPIHCDTHGLIELSKSPFSVSIAVYASACQSGHMALWCDLADANG
jgi:hypothetical protein